MSRTASLLGLLFLAAVGLSAGFAVDAASPGDSRSSQSAAATASFAPASFRFAKTSEEPETETVSPISLTASDGTGLALVALEANGVLEPPLAFTELHLTFDNPRDQTIEGRFRIALPPGAALSRFAMKIGDAWQEGEVVERQRARQVYEDFLHRRQDPALLEQEAGNEFSARVFPIPARGRKEIIVSYSHGLTRAGEPYVLPLRGLSKVGQLDVRLLLGVRPVAKGGDGIEVSDRRMVELHKRDWAPDRDFEVGQDRVDLAASGTPGDRRVGLRHDNLAVVRVAPTVEAAPQEIAGLYVLVDSSASRALGYKTQVRRLAELAAGLRGGAGGSTPLAVAAFDQEAVSIFEGTAAGFGEEEVDKLLSRRPLGASDLNGALGWLGDRLGRDRRGKYPRVLLITDGVATAGDTETRALKAAVRALGTKGVERLDVMAFGGLRDEAVLRELTAGNLAHDGQRIEGAAPLAEIARRLTLACRSGIKVEVAGAAWVWPEALDGVQPGDEVLVYADLGKGRTVRLSLGGRAVALGELVSTERPLLERAWVQARIDRLTHLRETAHAGDDDLRRAIGREITDLSVKHRVLSPFTALLVLETEFDYSRYGLDRRALADVLTVGPGGLDVLARRQRVLSPVDRVPVETLKREETAFEDLDSFEESAPGSAEEVDGAVVGGVEGGVEGGVAGGVVGGVPGGIAGGVVAGVPSPTVEPMSPPPPPAARPMPRPAPQNVAETVAGDVQPSQIPAEVPPEIAEGPNSKNGGWPEPYTGRFGDIMKLLAEGGASAAHGLAQTWVSREPGDVLALLALGEALEASGQTMEAARAYGSLIDLFPSRADLRRLAGERLERLGEPGLELAIDTYRKAALDRPDHPTGHRLLAWALLRTGHFQEAFEALETGLAQRYPGGRFAGADRVLREDLGLLAAVWLRAEPARRDEVLDRLRSHGARIESEPSLRFVLTWETDANDVDLHVWDRDGAHASYGNKKLPSGGELYADVTTGFGPECFAIHRSGQPKDLPAAPYRLRVHYYRRGPMGYGMGTLQVIRHDGKGGLSVEPRPFVVMADDAMIDMGLVEEKSQAAGFSQPSKARSR